MSWLETALDAFRGRKPKPVDPPLNPEVERRIVALEEFKASATADIADLQRRVRELEGV